MAAPVRRTCRRRCMGCDPCWICRFSYPTSITVTTTGSGFGSGGFTSCCGLLGGTYVIATPFGTAAIDNGVTIHQTFRTYSTCQAQWDFKQTPFAISDAPTYRNAVARCDGASEEPTGEWLTTAFIRISLGNGSTPRAADADSTFIGVIIDEFLQGDDVSGFYNVSRRESHRVNLAKPCPRSGSFSLAHVLTTVTSGGSAPACATTTGANYAVSITI